MLEAAGHVVRVVYDGKAALDAARATPPEVGLFDIGMPGLNGYELATELRRGRGSEALLLVALTGWGQDSDRERAREAGFDRHFVKPVDVDALLELLAQRASRPAEAARAG